MRERTYTPEPMSDALVEDDDAAGDPGARSGRANKGKLRGGSKAQRFAVARGMYEVADTWEKIYMLAAPVICVVAFYQAELGVPIRLRGLLFLAVSVYLGSCFLFLVMIDRRFAQRQHRRSRSAQAARIDTLNEQRLARQAVVETRRNRRQRDLAAQERGAERAAASGHADAAEDRGAPADGFRAKP